MESLLLKQLTLISDTTKSANQFEFSSRFNLITADDNSRGKSSLAKMITWAFGCSPSLDDTWNELSCKALLHFSIGKNCYWVARHGNLMFLSDNGKDFKKYTKITGDFSSDLAKITGFAVLLPNKSDKNKLESPPPSFYFLPFYIDQKRSWVKPWDSFENLQQYSSWQKNVIRYHTGYIKAKFFEIEKEISNKRNEVAPLQERVEKVDSALSIVSEYTGRNEQLLATSEDEFVRLTQEVESDLARIQKSQEDSLSLMAELQIEKQYLEAQFRLIETAASEFEQDYVFSVERIDGDELQCPLCGTIHDSSIASRTSILADKEAAEQQVVAVSKLLSKNSSKISSTKQKLEDIAAELKEIGEKFSSKAQEEQQPLSIDLIAAKSLEKIVANDRNDNIVKIANLDQQISSFKKQQVKLTTKPDREKLDTIFRSYAHTCINKLNATGVNFSKVNSPLDYKKLLGGGAAESARGALAYQLAVLKMIYAAGNEVPAPFIIDTPNQQEQTDINYKRIVELLLSSSPDKAQVILCAMDSPQLSAYKDSAKVFMLEENKLLDNTKYEKLQGLFDFMSADYSVDDLI